MRHTSRDVALANIELTSPRFSWVWNSNELPPHSAGYRLWYVFGGNMTAEGLKYRWDVPTSHILQIPRDREPMTLIGQPRMEVTLAILDYTELKPGPRMPSQCWKPAVPELMECLIHRIYDRAVNRQVWEANTLLEAILDETFLGEVNTPFDRETSDPKVAHQLTQAKLKNLNWSSTQRILVDPRPETRPFGR